MGAPKLLAILCLLSISVHQKVGVHGSTNSPWTHVDPSLGDYQDVTVSDDLNTHFKAENSIPSDTGSTLSPIHLEKAMTNSTSSPDYLEEVIAEETTTGLHDNEINEVKADTSSNATVFIIISLFVLTNLIKGIPVIVGEVLMRRAQKTAEDDFGGRGETRLENTESSNSMAESSNSMAESSNSMQMTISISNGKSMDSSINEIFNRGRDSISPEFSSGRETEEEILEDNLAYVKDEDEDSLTKGSHQVNGNKKVL